MAKQKKISVYYFFALWLVLSLMVFAQSKKAEQVTTANTSGITPNASYKVNDFDIINVQNGNLFLNFPIYSASGRQMDNSISLLYNSNLWRVIRVPDQYTPHGYRLTWDVANTGEDNLPDGWQLSIPKMTYDSSEYTWVGGAKLLGFYMYSLNENGSTHNFTNRINFPMDAMGNVSYDQISSSFKYFNGVSIDGTYMKYDMAENNGTSIITKRDGSRIFFSSTLNKSYWPDKYPDHIIDRNGNRLVFVRGEDEGTAYPWNWQDSASRDQTQEPVDSPQEQTVACQVCPQDPIKYEVISNCLNGLWFELSPNDTVAPNDQSPASYDITTVGQSLSLFPWLVSVEPAGQPAPPCNDIPCRAPNAYVKLMRWKSDNTLVALTRAGKVFGIKNGSAPIRTAEYYNADIFKGLWGATQINVKYPAGVSPINFNVRLNSQLVSETSNFVVETGHVQDLSARLVYTIPNQPNKAVDVSYFLEHSGLDIDNRPTVDAVHSNHPAIVEVTWSEAGGWVLNPKAAGQAQITVTLNSQWYKVFTIEVKNIVMRLWRVTGYNSQNGISSKEEIIAYKLVNTATSSGHFQTGDDVDIAVTASDENEYITNDPNVQFNCPGQVLDSPYGPDAKRLHLNGCGLIEVGINVQVDGKSANKFICLPTEPDGTIAVYDTDVLRGKSHPINVILVSGNTYQNITSQCDYELTSGQDVVSINNDDYKGLITGLKPGVATLTIKYCSGVMQVSDIPIHVTRENGLLTSIMDTNGRKIYFLYGYHWYSNPNMVDKRDVIKLMLDGFRFKDSDGVWQTVMLDYMIREQDWKNSVWGDIGSDQAPDQVSNKMLVISSITLPNGKQYTFEYNKDSTKVAELGYNQGRGQISAVTTPMGGVYTYEYNRAFIGINFDYKAVKRDVVIRRRQIGKGAWNYTYDEVHALNGQSFNNTVIEYPTSVGGKEIHYFKNIDGSVDEQEFYVEYYDGADQKVKTVEREWNTQDECVNGDTWDYIVVKKPQNNIRVFKEISLFHKAGQSWGKETRFIPQLINNPDGEHTYDPDGQPRQIEEYQVNPNGGRQLLRLTKRKYRHLNDNLTFNDYYTKNLLNLVSEEKIYGGAEDPQNLVSEKYFEYDTYTTEPLTSYGLTDTAYAALNFITPTGKRGNMTRVTGRLYEDGGYRDILQRHFYDDFGNVVKTRDGKNFDYLAEFSDAYKYAYPTTVTDPKSYQIINTYSPHTGALKTTKDPNLRPTSYAYDPMGRLTQVNLPDGGLTTVTYTDTVNNYRIKQKNLLAGSLYSSTETGYDGFGRPVWSLTEDPEGAISTETVYDVLGRVKNKLNPKRAEDASSRTFFSYDGLGRVIEESTTDGNTVTNNYDTPFQTLTTDQAGKWRIHTSDALGNILSTNENGLNTTYYSYNGRGALATVTQGGDRNRTFAYDTLGRLTQEHHPELGATENPGGISYTYDNNGNMLTRTQGGITTTCAYDSLNRITSAVYSGGVVTTPGITYYYDGQSPLSGLSLTNTTGRLSGTATGRIKEAYSFDAMGRIRYLHREIDGHLFSTAYEYDLAGNLTKVIYPSGRTVTMTVGKSSRVTDVRDLKSNSYPASTIKYTAFGGLTGFTYGNNVTFNWGYNNRLQPDVMTYKKSGTTNFFNLQLEYYNGAGQNNGNIQSIKNNLTNKTIGYTYDQVNRLLTSQEALTATPEQTLWSQNFTYDIYGNLKTKSGTNTPGINLSYSNKNRITNNGYEYDAAGNLKSDGAVNCTYDGRNQVVSASAGEYAYDADGNRIIKKINGANPQTTYYIYGPGGQVLAEYQLNKKGEPVWIKDLIYMNGRLVNEVKNSDPIPPVIQEIRVITIMDHQVTITWKTDEGADSQVKFGLTDAYGSQSVQDSQKVKIHTVTLTNLGSAKTYHFQVLSADFNGNLAESQDFTFQTLPDTVPPQIVSLTVTPGYISADFDIVTSEPTTCRILYGTTALDRSIEMSALAPGHVTAVSGLLQQTAYQYKIICTDEGNNEAEVKPEGTFTTKYDSTEPITPVVTASKAAQHETDRLSATWISSDPESGIAEYQYAISANPAGGTGVTDWISAGVATGITESGLQLSNGTIYYFSVKAMNNAGMWSPIGVSSGILVTSGDITPPVSGSVSDNGPIQEYLGSQGINTVLGAQWSFNDPEGIGGYQYAIGTSPGATNTKAWTNTSATSVSQSGLTLVNGATYYFSVKAKNATGLWSGVYSSSGIKVVQYEYKTITLKAGSGESGTVKDNKNMAAKGMEVCWVKVSGAWQQRQGLCSFNTSGIPTSAQILSAKLRAYVCWNQSTGNAITIDKVKFIPPVSGAYYNVGYSGCTDCKNIAIMPQGHHTWAEANIAAGRVNLGANQLTQFLLRTTAAQPTAGEYDGVMYANFLAQPSAPCDVSKPVELVISYKSPMGAVADPPSTCPRPEESGLLFSDDFCLDAYMTPENPANGWTVKQGSWWSQYGVLYLDYVEPADPAVNPDAEIYCGESTWDNYELTCKVRPEYNQARLGLAARCNPQSGDGYYLWLEPVFSEWFDEPIEYQMKLERRLNGETTLLSQGSFTKNFDWFTINLMLNGSILTASIDGSPLLIVADSEIYTGQAGLITANQLPLTAVDDFQVWDVNWASRKGSMLTAKLNATETQGPRISTINDQLSTNNYQQKPDPLAPLTGTSSGTTLHTSHLTLHNASHTSHLTPHNAVAFIPPLPVMGFLLLPIPDDDPPARGGLIQVTVPNGGENWEEGSLYEITWTGGVSTDKVRIDYSLDGGQSWINPAIVNAASNTGSYLWRVPGIYSGQCMVRVSLTNSSVDTDASDAVFSIIPPVATHELDADFNHDGICDILWRYYGGGASQGDVQIWYLNADGTIQGTKQLPNIGDLSWKISATRDFNNDQIPDLLWRYEGSGALQGQTVVWQLDVTGNVTGTVELARISDLNWKIAGVRDFDGDGIAEVIWRNFGNTDERGANQIWFLNPAGAIRGTRSWPGISDLNWKIAGTRDFNGDNVPDILWRYYGMGESQGQNSIWLMNSDGTVNHGTDLPQISDLHWKVAGIGKFDGDGINDILWRYYGPGALQGSNGLWFINANGTVKSTATLNTTPDLNWKIAGIGDYDNDGVADILWRYLQLTPEGGLQGSNGIWYMSTDGTIHNVEFLPTVTDLSWNISGSTSTDILEAVTPTEAELSLYYHWDHLGTTRVVTDKTGNVVESHDLLPYGDELTVPSSKDSYLFTSKMRDKESNLDYFSARYYSSKLGRFMSVDPIRNKKEAISNPQEWNLYSYCGNNPIGYIDKDGRIKQDANGNMIFKNRRIEEVSHPGRPGQKFKLQFGIVYADSGKKIEAAKNLSSERGFDTNCHGYTFAKGQVWIQNDQVKKILKEDGYKQKDNPEIGDVVVYYNKGEAVHSAKVTEIDNGNVRVEGEGGVFTEAVNTPVDTAWPQKGTTYNYYDNKQPAPAEKNTKQETDTKEERKNEY